MIEYADVSDDYYYHRSRTWNFVEPDIRDCTEAEPELARANPEDWPPIYLPAAWGPEKRAQWMARWREINA